MSSLTDWLGNTYTFAYQSPYSDQLLTNVTYPGGANESVGYSYDPAQFMTGETPSGPADSAPEAWAPTGNQLIGSQTGSGAPSGSYQYSPQNELTQSPTASYGYYQNGDPLTYTPAGASGPHVFWDNSAEQTVAEGFQTGNPIYFGYDAAGNRCWQLETGGSTSGASCSSPPTGAITYAWDGYGKLCGYSFGTASTCGSANIELTYDASGLLSSVSEFGNVTAELGYDTQLRPGQPLVAMDGTYDYVYGPATFGASTAPLEAIPAGATTTSSVNYMVSDASGPRVDFTSSGVQNTITYSDYGATNITQSASGNVPTPIGFEGMYTLPLLDYDVNRMYDPQTEQQPRTKVHRTGHPRRVRLHPVERSVSCWAIQVLLGHPAVCGVDGKLQREFQP